MRNVSAKCGREIETYILCLIFFFLNRAVYEIMWKDIAEPDRPPMTLWRMRIACWICRVTDTHAEYVVLIAVPQQEWLQEPASLLRYTYIACLVNQYKLFGTFVFVIFIV
jgi:hypothetical protein